MPSVKSLATRLTLTQLSKKKETTARNNLGFERLIGEFMREALKEGGTMAQPGESASATAAMVWWIVLSGRGSQLGALLINMGAYFEATGRGEVMKAQQVLDAIEKAKEMKRR